MAACAETQHPSPPPLSPLAGRGGFPSGKCDLNLQDTPARYGAVSVFNHWRGAALIAALLVSGPLAVWSGDRAIGVFGWFAIPSPLGEMPALHKGLEIVHALAAKVLLFTLAVHILAALKHVLLDRDGTLWRMLGRPTAAQ